MHPQAPEVNKKVESEMSLVGGTGVEGGLIMRRKVCMR